MNLTDAEENYRLRERIKLLEAIIESDRTKICDLIQPIKKELASRRWLMDGRGPYEWNDDRYRLEFGDASTALRAAIAPLEQYAADLSNSPQSASDVAETRMEQRKAGALAALKRIGDYWEDMNNGGDEARDVQRLIDQIESGEVVI